MTPLTCGGGRHTTAASPPARVFNAHLPVTFDPEAVTRPAWADYARWVVSAVVIRRYIDREADETSFVPLSSSYIDGHVPSKVRRPLLDDLIGAGVLECDGRYHFRRYLDGGPGKCLCYRLGPAHRGSNVRPHVVTHPELLRKLADYDRREREAVTDPVHLALRAWHERVVVLPSAPYYENVLLDLMIVGKRWFTVCRQGRVHTNVVNLPRQYRQYIRLGGRELTSCDVSTSQPLILGVLLANPGHKEGVALPRSHEAVLGTSSDPSLTDYLRDCLDGSVYDRVAARTGNSRDAVKQKFLAVLYGHPRDMGTKVGVAIKELYPAVFHGVVAAYYRLGGGGLARLMQTAESRVMIGRVAARLHREYPDMPLLTVHDSVLVPPEYAGRATAVIAEEWSDQFAVEPRVKTSDFTAPQAPGPKRRRKSKRRGPFAPGHARAA